MGRQPWVAPPWVDACSIATPKGPRQSAITRIALAPKPEQGGWFGARRFRQPPGRRQQATTRVTCLYNQLDCPGVVLARVAVDLVSTLFGLPLRQIALAVPFAPVLWPMRRPGAFAFQPIPDGPTTHLPLRAG